MYFSNDMFVYYYVHAHKYMQLRAYDDDIPGFIDPDNLESEQMNSDEEGEEIDEMIDASDEEAHEEAPVLARWSPEDAEALASESEYTDEFEFFEEESIDEEIADAEEAAIEAQAEAERKEEEQEEKEQEQE